MLQNMYTSTNSNITLLSNHYTIPNKCNVLITRELFLRHRCILSLYFGNYTSNQATRSNKIVITNLISVNLVYKLFLAFHDTVCGIMDLYRRSRNKKSEQIRMIQDLIYFTHPSNWNLHCYMYLYRNPSTCT